MIGNRRRRDRRVGLGEAPGFDNAADRARERYGALRAVGHFNRDARRHLPQGRPPAQAPAVGLRRQLGQQPVTNAGGVDPSGGDVRLTRPGFASPDGDPSDRSRQGFIEREAGLGDADQALRQRALEARQKLAQKIAGEGGGGLPQGRPPAQAPAVGLRRMFAGTRDQYRDDFGHNYRQRHPFRELPVAQPDRGLRRRRRSGNRLAALG